MQHFKECPILLTINLKKKNPKGLCSDCSLVPVPAIVIRKFQFSSQRPSEATDLDKAILCHNRFGWPASATLD